MAHWQHKRAGCPGNKICNGDIRIYASLDLECPDCSCKADIFDWVFLCPNHCNETRSLKDQGISSLDVINSMTKAILLNNLTPSERTTYRTIRDKLENRVY